MSTTTLQILTHHSLSLRRGDGSVIGPLHPTGPAPIARSQLSPTIAVDAPCAVHGCYKEERRPAQVEHWPERGSGPAIVSRAALEGAVALGLHHDSPVACPLSAHEGSAPGVEIWYDLCPDVSAFQQGEIMAAALQALPLPQ